jgi:lipoprotein-releasing system permease protein
MKEMLGLKTDEYSSVDLAVNDPTQADAVKTSLQKTLGDQYLVQTRYEQNKGLFGVMKTENWVIYGVLTLILAVASFNMIGALSMLVLEKQKDIHVLKAMGAHDSFIQKIFLIEGIMLSSIGGLTGILLAIAIAWMQVHYKLVPLEGNSFLVDYYPVKLKATDFLLVLLTIFVVGVLASWIPSRKAAAEPIELRS